MSERSPITGKEVDLVVTFHGVPVPLPYWKELTDNEDFWRWADGVNDAQAVAAGEWTEPSAMAALLPPRHTPATTIELPREPDPAPRRLLGWTVPRDVEYTGYEHGVEIICGHGHAEGVPTLFVNGAVTRDARVRDFLKAHAHGDDVRWAPELEDPLGENAVDDDTDPVMLSRCPEYHDAARCHIVETHLGDHVAWDGNGEMVTW